jgi:hypothetical protein
MLQQQQLLVMLTQQAKSNPPPPREESFTPHGHFQVDATQREKSNPNDSFAKVQQELMSKLMRQ